MLLYLSRVVKLEGKIIQMIKGMDISVLGKIVGSQIMGKVTVYTSFSFMLDTFDLSFRAMYPNDHLHLVTFRDHPKKVFERIKEEVESGESSADIVIGPHWMILNLQRSRLLKPYDSPEFAEYKQEFYDAKGAWCAIALSPVAPCIQYQSRIR